jgi:hypothetical protein
MSRSPMQWYYSQEEEWEGKVKKKETVLMVIAWHYSVLTLVDCVG